MFFSFARIIKFSLQDIFRNIWLSLVTVIILILALFTVNMLLMVKVIGDMAVEAVEEKIDVNLYLKPNAKEDEILALKAKINNLNEVKNVEYISNAQALKNFKEKHQDNPEILEALRELNINPLTLVIVLISHSLNTLAQSSSEFSILKFSNSTLDTFAIGFTIILLNGEVPTILYLSDKSSFISKKLLIISIFLKPLSISISIASAILLTGYSTFHVGYSVPELTELVSRLTAQPKLAY